jgi:5-methylcytosine-specific restriction enzyme subunit McrC
VNGVVSCREFGLVPVGGHSGLVDRELEHLVKLRETGPSFFSEERRAASWHCRFAGFAGAIVMPSGRTLEILPKIGDEAEAPARRLIMRMLAATRLAPAVEHNLDDYASSPHLIEAYLRLAADLTLQHLRRGLVHAYRRLDLRLPVVRGRLRIAAQLARLPERLDAHLLSADVFTADTDLNRAIKGGISRIERLSRVTDTRARCRELLARLDAVADPPRESQQLAALLRGLVLDRRHAHFASLIRVLKLIVTDQGSCCRGGRRCSRPCLAVRHG